MRESSKEDDDKEEDDDSDSSDSDSDNADVQLAAQLRSRYASNQKWIVTPDYGELDPSVVTREKDTGNGEKFSGWTNPLGWTDDGSDDDLVTTQLAAVIRYDESEGPTKVDNGDVDYSVIHREADTGNGVKFSGWTNPLGWPDTGNNDEAVV